MKEKTQGCSADHGHWIMVQHCPAYLDLKQLRGASSCTASSLSKGLCTGVLGAPVARTLLVRIRKFSPSQFCQFLHC